MADFAFIKSGGVTVKLNSKVLGGVMKAVCTAQNEVYNIGQFLTDEPAGTITSGSYLITLDFKCSNDSPDADTEISSIKFSDGFRTVRYTDCSVVKTEKTAAAGDVVMSLAVRAETRETV